MRKNGRECPRTMVARAGSPDRGEARRPRAQVLPGDSAAIQKPSVGTQDMIQPENPQRPCGEWVGGGSGSKTKTVLSRLFDNSSTGLVTYNRTCSWSYRSPTWLTQSLGHGLPRVLAGTVLSPEPLWERIHSQAPGVDSIPFLRS